MDDQHNEEDSFNPIGTVWLMVLYILMIIAFWGWAYIEMLALS